MGLAYILFLNIIIEFYYNSLNISTYHHVIIILYRNTHHSKYFDHLYLLSNEIK